MIKQCAFERRLRKMTSKPKTHKILCYHSNGKLHEETYQKVFFLFFYIIFIKRYVNTALGLCVAMESCIKQNNAIEIYEVLFLDKALLFSR